MKELISPRGAVVRSWASILEPKALEQAFNTAESAVMGGPLALMPDSHVGFGAVVGSVLYTEGGLIPSACGVDLSCGVLAMRTQLSASDLTNDVLNNVLSTIRKSIPTGPGGSHGWDFVPGREFLDQYGEPFGLTNSGLTLYRGRGGKEETPLTSRRDHFLNVIVQQFGTLGSGNHFIEVSVDELDRVWLVLHSGSRGIGLNLAEAHIQRAKRQYEGPSLPDDDLAPLIEGTYQFEDYLNDMWWAQTYAEEQRQCMMSLLSAALQKAVRKEIDRLDEVHCTHNYTEIYGNGFVTRKGAIDASEGTRGVIPGSMATSTYIVEGLGNKLAYDSAPHGAGRLRSRGESRRSLNLDDFKKSMEGRVWLTEKAEGLLDESPEAYKEIGQVMEDAADLITPIHRLEARLNYKG